MAIEASDKKRKNKQNNKTNTKIIKKQAIIKLLTRFNFLSVAGKVILISGHAYYFLSLLFLFSNEVIYEICARCSRGFVLFIYLKDTSQRPRKPWSKEWIQ